MENAQGLDKVHRVRRLATFAHGVDRRVVFIALGVAGIGVALYLGWSWLAAAGMTTFIIALLPCTVMCGLGLCAGRFAGNGTGNCHGSGETDGTAGTTDSQKTS